MDSEAQESMKADIDQLKTQMGQMFEMMVALKDAIAVRNEETQSSPPLYFNMVTLMWEIETFMSPIRMVCL